MLGRAISLEELNLRSTIMKKEARTIRYLFQSLAYFFGVFSDF